MSDAPVLTHKAYEPVVIEYPVDLRSAPGAGWCRVYWGSHGCNLERGHVQRDGTPHDCGCCGCERHPYPDWPDTGILCVAKEPYYGPGTSFYGEDATPETVSRWGQVIEGNS